MGLAESVSSVSGGLADRFLALSSVLGRQEVAQCRTRAPVAVILHPQDGCCTVVLAHDAGLVS